MKYRKFFIIMFCIILLGSVMSLISPILLNYWSSDTIGFTQKRLTLLALILLLSSAIELVLIWFREKFAKGFNISNCKSMLSDFFHLQYDYINDEGPTKIINKISASVNSIYSFMTGSYIRIWSSMLVMLAVLIMVSFDNLIVTAVMIVLVPVNYFGYKALNASLLKKSRILQEATSSGWQEIISVAGQTDYLKQCESYDNILHQVTPSLSKIYGAMADINIFAQCVSRFLFSINQIARIMLMAFTVYCFTESDMSPMRLVLYSILLPLYFDNLTIVTDSNLSKREMNTATDFINNMKENKEPNGSYQIALIDNITFDIKELTVKNQTLTGDIQGTFSKGDVVWVKGGSGTGKSTLLKLLPKFRLSESVYINSRNIREIDNSSLRHRLNYLSQNVPVIKGTVRDNLFLNRTYDSSLEDKFIKDPLVMSVLKGRTMDTLITEGGSSLSGGEKQKIAIVRTLYDDVDVMILDEITSNIDKQSAVDILDRLMKEKDRHIIFIISHDDLPEVYSNKSIQL